jgi:hypothetical protein
LPDDQKTKPPIQDFERDLVLPPDDMLRDKRRRLLDAIEATSSDIARQRGLLARLEERDRLLHAALDDMEAAIGRLHLKPTKYH